MFTPEFNQEESAQENLDFPQSLKLFNIGAHVICSYIRDHKPSPSPLSGLIFKLKRLLTQLISNSLTPV